MTDLKRRKGNMNFESNWAKVAQQFQETLGDAVLKAVAFNGLAKSSPPTDKTFPAGQFDAVKMADIQQAYIQQASALWNKGLTSESAPAQAPADRRFADDAWQRNSLAHFSAASYLLNSEALMGMADAFQGDEKTKSRVRFAVEQWLAAAAPSNFLALNAEAQKKAIDSQGASIAQGLQNLMHDMRQGHVSMTDESNFEVGKNVATSEGAVVFENDFFQLLEYKPLTATVYEKPLLLVPPCINKFYILDLQPANSLIRYAVQQGHRTFVLSWRNPDESMQEKTWDDYIQHAAIEAIRVTREISGAKTLNALGFCVGGTILATALAVLAARGEKPVSSVTFLTSLLDFSDTGILDIFIDETAVKFREMQLGQGGLLKGQDLASTFSFLRPNDLVWNYVVGNYLKGDTPPPFDLLYWNSDSTNLPGPFYAWYLRNTYHENNLIKPGKLTVCGQPLDLSQLDMPAYIYGSREDHIVPIQGAYASTHVLTGPKRFVMGASGHIAGVINPPSKNKRSYWTSDTLKTTHEEWLLGATEQPGSWWSDWSAWLKRQAGKLIAAPQTYGSRQHKVIEPAPGRYVKVKVKA
jgi:polyhydroxyalkanoate synthase